MFINPSIGFLFSDCLAANNQEPHHEYGLKTSISQELPKNADSQARASE